MYVLVYSINTRIITLKHYCEILSIPKECLNFKINFVSRQDDLLTNNRSNPNLQMLSKKGAYHCTPQWWHLRWVSPSGCRHQSAWHRAQTPCQRWTTLGALRLVHWGLWPVRYPSSHPSWPQTWTLGPSPWSWEDDIAPQLAHCHYHCCHPTFKKMVWGLIHLKITFLSFVYIRI